MFASRAVRIQPGGYDKCLAELMIENDDAVVKAYVAIRQLQIVQRAAREFGFGKVFKIVAPNPKTSAQGKRQVQFIENFTARHQRVQDLPRIAKLNVLGG